jgi:hypothetical protein
MRSPGWDALFRIPVPERIEKLRDRAYRAELKPTERRVLGSGARRRVFVC